MAAAPHDGSSIDFELNKYCWQSAYHSFFGNRNLKWITFLNDLSTPVQFADEIIPAKHFSYYYNWVPIVTDEVGRNVPRPRAELLDEIFGYVYTQRRLDT